MLKKCHGPRLLVANCLGRNNCLGSGKSQSFVFICPLEKRPITSGRKVQNPRREINDEDTGRMNGITNGHDCFHCSFVRYMSNRFFKTNVFVTMVLQMNEQIDFFFEKNFVKFLMWLSVGQKTVTFCLLQNNAVTQFYLCIYFIFITIVRCLYF